MQRCLKVGALGSNRVIGGLGERYQCFFKKRYKSRLSIIWEGNKKYLLVSQEVSRTSDSDTQLSEQWKYWWFKPVHFIFTHSLSRPQNFLLPFLQVLAPLLILPAFFCYHSQGISTYWCPSSFLKLHRVKANTGMAVNRQDVLLGITGVIVNTLWLSEEKVCLYTAYWTKPGLVLYKEGIRKCQNAT